MLFELRERYSHDQFSDHLSIHLLQLSKLKPTRHCEDARLHRWARFLAAKNDAQFEQLAAEDPIMKLAKQTLERLSQDPETLRKTWERQEALMLYNRSLAAGEAKAKAKWLAEGMAKGMAKGMAHALLDLLGVRFGRLADQSRARIEVATVEQLGVWTKRVLTAKTLDEVFAP